MKDEDFEKKLKAMGGALTPSNPTSEWKDEIVSRALRKADATRSTRQILPPRWLIASWGTAWAAVLVMNFVTPTHSIPSDSQQVNVASVAKADSTAETLLAYNRRLDFNIDPP